MADSLDDYKSTNSLEVEYVKPSDTIENIHAAYIPLPYKHCVGEDIDLVSVLYDTRETIVLLKYREQIFKEIQWSKEKKIFENEQDQKFEISKDEKFDFYRYACSNPSVPSWVDHKSTSLISYPEIPLKNPELSRLASAFLTTQVLSSLSNTYNPVMNRSAIDFGFISLNGGFGRIKFVLF
jgi:hypothetical protein